jgi:periplasmic protein TonB
MENSQDPRNYSSALRNLIALPLGILVSLALFALLSDLTSPDRISLADGAVSPELDFLLVDKDSELEIRDRKRPPPIEALSELEVSMPKTAFKPEPLSVSMPSESFQLPDIDVGLAIDMSPALADISAAEVNAQMFAIDIPFQNTLVAMKNVAPRYPSRAQRRKVEGRLVAEFLVNAQGYVKEESIKFIEADPVGVFEKSVIRSLKRSRFEMMKSQGQAVVYRARKTYNFKMPK